MSGSLTPEQRAAAAMAMLSADFHRVDAKMREEFKKAMAAGKPQQLLPGEPRVCLSCGARINAGGALPCGH